MGSRATIDISERQTAIVIGKVLGDDCLEKNGKHTRLKVDHSERQKEYVFWLHRELSSLIPSKPYQIQYRRKGVINSNWRFATYSLPVFDEFRLNFYGNHGRQVPAKIKSLLNPLSLAVWYMDDGYKRTDRSGVYLCTSSFSKSDHSKLMACLLNAYGLKTKVHYAGGYPRIHIPSKDAKRFCTIIKPFILDSLSYKLL